MPSHTVKSFLQFVNEDKDPFENYPEYLYTPEAEALRDAGLLPKLKYHSARKAIILLLKKYGPSSESEIQNRILEFERMSKDSKYSHRSYWNRATVTSTLEFLMKKGIIERTRVRNPKSNRMAYIYSLTS